MASITIFEYPIFRDFILPFLLIFVVLFGILQKTKILGDGKKQVDALTAFVIALIFVSFGNFVGIVNGLVLYFSVAIVVILLFMIIYGFVSSDEKGFKPQKWMAWVFGILGALVLIAAILIATDSFWNAIGFLFSSSWSSALWANVLFIVIVAGAVALMLRSTRSS